jgi:universal stress protein E
MAERIRRILVAIRDLRHAPKSELRKAGALARAAHGSIELFHAIEDPDPARSWPETATLQSVEKQRSAIAARYEERLEHFARDPSLRGASVSCTATWDHPVHEAIIRRALESRADLVIAATHTHPLGARFLRNTDWELIRHCPLPLLLAKSPREYRRPVVLAAVDPFHAHARPANLDARLIDTGEKFAQLLRGTLHLFHAYMPLVTVAPTPMGTAPLVTMPPEAEAAHGEQIARVIGQLAKSADVPPARRHIEMGEVSAELASVARRTRTSLIVMGAVSRSAVARLFIGNTAERVLDKVGCDVLVVKPRGFRSSVAASSRPPSAVRSRARVARPPARARRTGRRSTEKAPTEVLPPLL